MVFFLLATLQIFLNFKIISFSLSYFYEFRNLIVHSFYDTTVRTAIVYSLFSSCKAHGVDVRSWLENALQRIPTEKAIDQPSAFFLR